jgi:hypothetical protein
MGAMRWWLAALLLLSLPTPADACPAGRPCNKYKTVQQPAPVQHYKRATAAAVPRFSEARVAKFLAAATWQPVPALVPAATNVRYVPAPRLKFLDASRVTTTPANKPGERIVLVRRLAQRDGAILIDVDGVVHTLGPCDGAKRFACLVPRPDLPFDPPDESDQERQQREEREQLIREQRGLTKALAK